MQLAKILATLALGAVVAAGMGCGGDDSGSDNKGQQADPCANLCDQVAACPGVPAQEVANCRTECPVMRADFEAANCRSQLDATLECARGAEVCDDSIPAGCQKAINDLVVCTLPYCLANPTAPICADKED